ncbi:MAG: hypothetical protein H6613_18865 [Ignavibacteriales bacterium]|nr:hypothetical protein [Ignavibacteriales bacterium]
MKKIFFILVLFFAVTSISYSQIINGYGIKIGGTFANQDWNYSNLTPITDFNSDSKLGFNAGIFVDFFNLQFMSFLTELNFVQKEWKKIP